MPTLRNAIKDAYAKLVNNDHKLLVGSMIPELMPWFTVQRNSSKTQYYFRKL